MTARNELPRLPLRRGVSPLRLAMVGLPTVWTFILAVPLILALLIAFKSPSDYAQHPLGLPHAWQWSNFAAAWNDANLGYAFVNDAIVTAVTIGAVIAGASLAAYAIVRGGGRLMKGSYFYFLSGLIVPFQLGIPTLYRIWVHLHLVDNLPGVILIDIGAGLPFAVFLFVGGMRTLPIAIEEAAWMDGANSWRVFWRIVFPQLKPVTATAVIFTSIGVWNDLIVSLYFLQSPHVQTISQSLASYMSNYADNWPLIFASVAMALIPVLAVYVLLQRFFISGLTAGAVR